MDKRTVIFSGLLATYGTLATLASIGGISDTLTEGCRDYAKENKDTISHIFEAQTKSGLKMRHVYEKGSYLGMPYYCVVTPSK